jgi:plasmid stabilization system protein ParE
MIEPLDVLLTRRAERQIEAIDRWWIENRTAASLLFKRELSRTLKMIAVTPTLGTPASSARWRAAHPDAKNGVPRLRPDR